MTDASLERALKIKEELKRRKSSLLFFDKKVKELAGEAFRKENKTINVNVVGSGYINNIDLDLFVELLESQRSREETIINNLEEEFAKL